MSVRSGRFCCWPPCAVHADAPTVLRAAGRVARSADATEVLPAARGGVNACREATATTPAPPDMPQCAHIRRCARRPTALGRLRSPVRHAAARNLAGRCARNLGPSGTEPARHPTRCVSPVRICSNTHDFKVRQTWVAAVAHPANCWESRNRHDIIEALAPASPSSFAARDSPSAVPRSATNQRLTTLTLSNTGRAKPREAGGGERRAWSN